MTLVKPDLIQKSTSIQIDWCLNIYEETSFHKSSMLTQLLQHPIRKGCLSSRQLPSCTSLGQICPTNCRIHFCAHSKDSICCTDLKSSHLKHGTRKKAEMHKICAAENTVQRMFTTGLTSGRHCSTEDTE